MIVAVVSITLAFSRGPRPTTQPLHSARSVVAVDGGQTFAKVARPTRHAPAQLYLADDPTGYAFMLPTAVAVATSCQLCGIGGAALFSPIFLLIFPLLGPEYPLDSPAAAIASALLTEVFGFSSGLSGYARRGLVAWPVALQFSAVAVPLAFGGAPLCASLDPRPYADGVCNPVQPRLCQARCAPAHSRRTLASCGSSTLH